MAIIDMLFQEASAQHVWTGMLGVQARLTMMAIIGILPCVFVGRWLSRRGDWSLYTASPAKRPDESSQKPAFSKQGPQGVNASRPEMLVLMWW